MERAKRRDIAELAIAIKEGGKAAITAKRVLLNFIEYGLDVDDYFTNE